eukprot:CAMPEP_0179192316 /NCGR_PEP_ID=MMETSP0796-20121207/95548_1 /TAXON_ID=73915 /ORGANISM="Pyrodinium bahamense, Strain pbaha01" /LENGTH=62 /DNA_ID=CAMNT_0020896585 /DNA_START=29 /DNA_END=214 /DNA_ORIENTATION=+
MKGPCCTWSNFVTGKSGSLVGSWQVMNNAPGRRAVACWMMYLCTLGEKQGECANTTWNSDQS